MIEFKDQELAAFEEVMDLLKQYSDFEVLHPATETQDKLIPVYGGCNE